MCTCWLGDVGAPTAGHPSEYNIRRRCFCSPKARTPLTHCFCCRVLTATGPTCTHRRRQGRRSGLMRARIARVEGLFGEFCPSLHVHHGISTLLLRLSCAPLMDPLPSAVTAVCFRHRLLRHPGSSPQQMLSRALRTQTRFKVTAHSDRSRQKPRVHPRTLEKQEGSESRSKTDTWQRTDSGQPCRLEAFLESPQNLTLWKSFWDCNPRANLFFKIQKDVLTTPLQQGIVSWTARLKLKPILGQSQRAFLGRSRALTQQSPAQQDPSRKPASLEDFRRKNQFSLSSMVLRAPATKDDDNLQAMTSLRGNLRKA